MSKLLPALVLFARDLCSFQSRTKSRKEKNKLASRACRLKKKAQHEANKIKLCGLEDEHSEYTARQRGPLSLVRICRDTVLSLV